MILFEIDYLYGDRDTNSVIERTMFGIPLCACMCMGMSIEYSYSYVGVHAEVRGLLWYHSYKLSIFFIKIGLKPP